MKNTLNSFACILLSVLCVYIVLSLSGCAVAVQSHSQTNSSAPPEALGNAELYTHELANELFLSLAADRQYRYAVAGFVPVTTLKQNLNKQGPLMLLGHQLEQGLTTEAVRRGYIAQDFKATNTIIMGADSERALSRNVEHLRSTQNIDFFITGTITEQEMGAMVNARIINVRTKDVIAAATKFFPAEIFWQREQVTTRNGLLYRAEKPAKAKSRVGE
ncbi:FlgO family outer membrane protein [Agaribacter flavus]|uniref:FlgO family outer membrane protein n=1 Tax=Agaribacter flavus TaxID=1902781 RepID=A0ABV7FPV9_9ALTE